MNINIKNILKIKTEWWCGHIAIQIMLGRLDIHYKFLGWQNQSWRNGVLKDMTPTWKLWYKQPVLSYKKWEDSLGVKYSCCILYNDFTFKIVDKKALWICYDYEKPICL